MGEDRFHALLLLYVHKDIEIDISKVAVSDKIATTVIIGFIVVKITQALIFILKLQI
jgi:hypothetical protein